MYNILDNVFLTLTLYFLISGYIIYKYEDYLPAFVLKVFKYGNFAHQGKGGEFVRSIEIPKSLYKHFYLYAVAIGVAMLMEAIAVYFYDFPVNKYWYATLNFLFQKSEPSVSVATALLALLLIISQCSRRYYETCNLQVFSKTSRMNVIHYFLAMLHYSGIIVPAIGEAPLFCGAQNRDRINWIDVRTMAVSLPCIALFFWAWKEQYRCNVILASLRRDKKGEVVSEEYKVPRGRLFEVVSSPHRLCEIIIYFVYLVLVPTKTYFFIFLWVLVNQTWTAVYTNEWYKKTFKDFPKHKKAIIPWIL